MPEDAQERGQALERRVAELEGLVTFQERSYEQLNQVIVEQGRLIEALERRVEALTTSLRTQGGQVRRAQDEDPPPHY